MKTVRYTAAIATIVISLLNLPIAFDDGGQGLPKALAYLITLLGVLGIAAGVGLLANQSWGPTAAVAIGAVNLIGAIIALIQDRDGAIIGLVLSLIVTGLGLASLRLQSRAPLAA
jgi:peptidoglycan/LPS O-acetylase OafA/YrhL